MPGSKNFADRGIDVAHDRAKAAFYAIAVGVWKIWAGGLVRPVVGAAHVVPEFVR